MHLKLVLNGLIINILNSQENVILIKKIRDVHIHIDKYAQIKIIVIMYK